jgi:hypothetical protein
VEKKLSATALSQQLPLRLMLCTAPACASCARKLFAANSMPRSEWKSSPADDEAGVQVEHCGQVQVAAAGDEFGRVVRPALVCTGGWKFRASRFGAIGCSWSLSVVLRYRRTTRARGQHAHPTIPPALLADALTALVS